MNLKKFALRGLAVLAVAVALCMFFSGTIKTITTAKVKLTRTKTGRLEEKTQLSGKLVFTGAEPVQLKLAQGQSLLITKVNARVGYAVKAGDVIVEARVADYENAMRSCQASYDEALDQLLALESKNSGIRLRRSDEVYADAYFNLRELKKQELAQRIDMEALLAKEGMRLPEEGLPEGASEELAAAINAYRDSVQAQAQAQADMDAAARYLPDDATWSYISGKRSLEERLAAAEEEMRALSTLNTRAQAIEAPCDGYIVELMVKAGDGYDGSGALFTISPDGSMPVLRADISAVEKNVSEGMAANMASDRYGTIESKVIETGLDAEGKRYADIEVTEKMIAACGSIYAMTAADTDITLVNRAKSQTTLLSASTVHGTGDDRYIYTVETSYSSLGNSKMTVHKMAVTVLAEAEGMVSIEEELGYYDIAYMEDRPISDGDSVMLYSE